MNGIGNEIAILDLRGTGLSVNEAQAREIHRGLAFDQLMVLREPQGHKADAFMTIFNRDGSLSGACGNGTRCVASYLVRSSRREAIILETAAAELECWPVSDGIFTVDMGVPRLAWNEIPLREPFHDTRNIELQIGPIDAPLLHTPSAVNMGNPHAIFFVDDVEAYDLGRIGPLLENHPIFPERANISLAQILSREAIRLKVWERGTGLTKACGSAACAALVAAARKGLTGQKAKVSLPGGDLTIEWRESDGHVLMTGPVEFEFETRLDAEFFRHGAR
ncbi:MAG TPA: diaminopimelate epimerase [Methylocella sp.]|nr:diaminopimelate epimerase [Methylocella sp.]